MSSNFNLFFQPYLKLNSDIQFWSDFYNDFHVRLQDLSLSNNFQIVSYYDRNFQILTSRAPFVPSTTSTIMLSNFNDGAILQS